MKITKRYTQTSRKGIETHLDITVIMSGRTIDRIVSIEAVGLYGSVDVTSIMVEHFSVDGMLDDNDFAELCDVEDIALEND